jgi:hypothetical protein
MPWQRRKGSWYSGNIGRHQPDVRLIDVRQNRRVTFNFEQKPSDAVRAVLQGDEHEYHFDGADRWSTPSLAKAEIKLCRSTW